MLDQFGRVVTEAAPDWFLCENVPGVPSLEIHGYTLQRFNLFGHECGVPQSRNRAFQFGSRDGMKIVLRRTVSQLALAPCVMATDGRTCFADLCALQGLPRGFDLPGLSRTAKIRAVGNGVPVPMARCVAEAIRDRSCVTVPVCGCDCGRLVTGRQTFATAACRKRIERARKNPRPWPDAG
jgi:DNA (cytosine-5)-methyltransferase 1